LSPLQERWDSIERKKAQILAHVKRMDPKAQARPPRRNEWTPLQVVEHLVLAEELQNDSIRDTHANLRHITHCKPTLALKPVLWVLRNGVRVPNPESMEPSGRKSIEALEEAWTAQRAILKERLDAIGGDAEENTFQVHPQLGRMSAPDVLDITEAHLMYHARHLGVR